MKPKFPPKKDIERISHELSKGLASETLGPDATDLEKLKYEICKAFIKYKQRHRLSQRELAEEIGANESVVSKMVHYKIDQFTVDRLMRYLTAINSRVTFKVKVA